MLGLTYPILLCLVTGAFPEEPASMLIKSGVGANNQQEQAHRVKWQAGESSIFEH
jgi:hypothetical protein